MKQSREENEMKVLGITGGVGSGKSEVLHYIKEKYHATVVQLDEVAKELQKSQGICYTRILELFGKEMAGVDGELDRQKLAAVIFQDEESRKRMNDTVHPEVKRWVKHDIEEKKYQNVPLYIIEAALLPEAGYDDICQELWYIYTEEHIRRERLKQSRGYSDEKISQMLKSQSSEETFRKACKIVIDNSGDFEDTKKQIGEKI